MSGRNFSLKEMETMGATAWLTLQTSSVRKELLSERDGNFTCPNLTIYNLSNSQEGTSL